MYQTQSGNFLVHVALVLCAAILGSVLTLLMSNRLVAPGAPGQKPDLNNGTVSSSPISRQQIPVAAAVADGVEPDTIDVGLFIDDDSVSYALDQAAAERAQLAQSLALLNQQIETLEADVINIKALAVLEASSYSEESSFPSDGQPDDTPPGTERFTNFGVPRSSQDTIDNLVASGVDVDRAQAFQTSQNQYQLARLELFDLAEREGWSDSEEFSSRLEALDEQRPDLREELGDEAYDRYLFEAGQSNRVVVASIIPGSAAELAGLQTGDIVLSYADQRVFSTRDLQRATRSGQRNEAVSIIVERQAQRLFLEVPRGPLGVSLSAQQQSPS